MADRTAIDAIRGYFYQFDYSIASILKLSNDTDSILIEGIEDVDIKTANDTVATQCKYYENTEYNHSVIKKPIMFMLDHFKQVKLGNQPQIKYKLRGYYESGHSKLSLPLSLQNLKDDFLTYTQTEKINNVNTKVKHFHHDDLKLNDVELNDFLQLLEIDINAIEFEKQYNDIISLLKSTFSCSAFLAEFYFYNSSLKVIRDISKDKNQLNRNISKIEFLKRINNSSVLFNEWFILKKGENAHYSNLRKEYFGSVNILFKERFFLFEINPNSYSRSDLKTLLNLVIKNYTKIINQPTPFSPYIYIHGVDNLELIELKKDLIEDEIIIIDGFDFEGAEFNPKSVIKKPAISNQIKLKFINNINFLKDTIALTGRRSEIYQFYLNDIFFDYNSSSIKEIKIQVDNLNKIKNII
ncbi:DUF4297 family anti-phage-associated protein [Flavobacterium ajazii]|uniref:DUF4297 family anti-phage-associated protein n=1 Tax=Flavobacterium ajazii TaxID=2692318 RepID=UPI0013D16E89|nr:DUF4297 family anti-phage-associated protein [Flavobacterium ajazii]